MLGVKWHRETARSRYSLDPMNNEWLRIGQVEFKVVSLAIVAVLINFRRFMEEPSEREYLYQVSI